MELALQDAGIIGLLASVVLLLVREILQRKRSDILIPGERSGDPFSHRAIHANLKALSEDVRRLAKDHDDSDSKFSTVHVMHCLTSLESKIDILMERSAQILRERGGA